MINGMRIKTRGIYKQPNLIRVAIKISIVWQYPLNSSIHLDQKDISWDLTSWDTSCFILCFLYTKVPTSNKTEVFKDTAQVISNQKWPEHPIN